MTTPNPPDPEKVREAFKRRDQQQGSKISIAYIGDAEVIEAAARAWLAQQDGGWRDISTAPRDGSSFIFCNGSGFTGIGWFMNEKHFACQSWGGTRDTTATHWQPLPAPPVIAASEGAG